MILVDVDFDDLRQRIEGAVIVRGSAGYGRVATIQNARFDHIRPHAVVRCKTIDDVGQAIAFARQHDLPLAVRSGGHCFAGRSCTTGITIDVSPMNSISVAGDIAVIGTGARLGEVYSELLSYGLTIPAGTCPSVGIGGFVLGGGFGMLGRKHGVASDHLVAARIVLADGRVVECTYDREPELFWALRGAGTGHFGVVTELTIRAIEVPSITTTFNLTWPMSQAVPVMAAWLHWIREIPEEIAASLVLRAGGNPDEPATVEVFVTVLGTRTDAMAGLESLRVKADPTSQLIRERSYGDMLTHWSGRASERDGTSAECHEFHIHYNLSSECDIHGFGGPVRSVDIAKSEFFARTLPDQALDAFVNHLETDRTHGQKREIDFSAWGGAYGRMSSNATAFVHRGWAYGIKHSVTMNADASTQQREIAHRWVNECWSIPRPWGTGHVYPNFPDPDLEAWGRAYYGSNYSRLLKIKATYDPDNAFRFRQSLPVS